MRLDGPDVADPKRLVVREIELIHFAIGERDLVAHHVADPVTDPAFHLGSNDVRIDRNSAIHRAGHLLDDDPVFCIARDLDYFGHERAEGLVHGDAAAATLGNRTVPARLLGCKAQDARHASLIRRAAVQVFHAILDRIPAGGRRRHVHHGLHHVSGMAVANGAPPVHGDGRPVIREADMLAGDIVRRVMHAFNGRGIDSVLHDECIPGPALEDRLACHAMVPADNPAAFVKSDAHLVRHCGPVVPAPDVVLAGPDQLDGLLPAVQRKGERRFHVVVRGLGRAATKRAARVEGRDLDVFLRNLQHCRQGHLGAGGHLATVMEHHAGLGRRDRACERLHGRVGEIREEEIALDDLCGPVEQFSRFGCAALRVEFGVGVHCRQEICLDLVGTAIVGLGKVPLGDCRVAGLKRGPRVHSVDQDSCARRQGNGADEARNIDCGTVIKGSQGAAEPRAAKNDGHDLVLQMEVHGIDSGPVGLGTVVTSPRVRIADDRELGRILQARRRRHVPGRRGCHEIADRRGVSACGQLAVGQGDAVGRNAPGLRSRGNEHLAGGGAGLAVLHV